MEETFGEIKAERGIRGVAEASDVREHLVAGEGPYLTLVKLCFQWIHISGCKFALFLV